MTPNTNIQFDTISRDDNYNQNKLPTRNHVKQLQIIKNTKATHNKKIRIVKNQYRYFEYHVPTQVKDSKVADEIFFYFGARIVQNVHRASIIHSNARAPFHSVPDVTARV